MNFSRELTLLRGENVILRQFSETDITSEYLSWLNDPHVTRFSNQRFYSHTRESANAYFMSFIDNDNLFLSILNPATGHAIGTMTAYISNHHKTADLGLLIGDSESWGKGYGQDAWNTLGNWLFNTQSIRKLTGGAAVGNVAMVKIMERFDMGLEATRVDQELIDGEPHDLVYYAKFNHR